MLDQYNTTIADWTGQRWHFVYTGGASVIIRRHLGTGDDIRDSEWIYEIDLNAYSMSPERITPAWIDTRAAAWIKRRNDELAAGLYKPTDHF